MTARIAIRFLAPVHINQELDIAAELRRERGRRLDVHGALREGDTLLAESEVSFIHVPLEHFLRTPEGRAARDYWVARLDDARRDA